MSEQKAIKDASGLELAGAIAGAYAELDRRKHAVAEHTVYISQLLAEVKRRQEGAEHGDA